MESLRSYLNSLTAAEKDEFRRACNTSIGYLRKAICEGDLLRESLCIAIERESGGRVRLEDLRPDVDWAYVRNSGGQSPSASLQASA